MIIEFVSAKLGGRCEVGLTALREELSATQSERERERERGEGGGGKGKGGESVFSSILFFANFSYKLKGSPSNFLVSIFCFCFFFFFF